MLHGLTIIRDAFARTVRLVSTARLRPPVLERLVDATDIEALAEIEGATSNRLLAQDRGAGAIQAAEFVFGVPHAAYINASFAYARPRQLNRFNGTELGAWYAALESQTCLEEVVFHMTEELSRVGEYEATVEYAEMFASMAGEFVDLRAHADHPALSPNVALGYPAGNAIAEHARAAGLTGVIYPSVRHAGGTCFAALRPHAVQSVATGAVYRITWAGSPQPRIEKV